MRLPSTPLPSSRSLLACLAAVAAACGGSRGAAPPASMPVTHAPPATAPASHPVAATPALPPAPTLRLPPGVRPTGYALDVTVDPTTSSIHGKIEIQLALSRTTSVIWLNDEGPKITDASIAWPGSAPVVVHPVQASPDFLAVPLPRPLGPGGAHLHLAFTAAQPVAIPEGAFREKAAGAWYSYTQFESTSARQAFPCFDEPSFKVPWRVTLHVPAGDLAASNTPIAGDAPDPHQAAMHTVAFAPTRPLPSYLVAWAVGPFDAVDLGKVGAKGTPMRILVPHGRAADAAYAAKAVPAFLVLLEKYFGMPYPYPKLDIVDVPRFFGAMENAGLITCLEAGLLSPPAQESVSFHRRLAMILSHEMAHQWVGDLVTTAWWNDIWLNEAFAEWMDMRITSEWQPSWNARSLEAPRRLGAMMEDTLASARAIRQPIVRKGDIEDAFDGITYDKGASVISGFEEWLGPAVFQKGVQLYLQSHADGNATAADFLAALSKEADKDVATPFSTFLDQPGLPLVSVTLSCARGAPPSLALAQTRAVPEGSKAPAERWQIPVCVRYGTGGRSSTQCTLLTQAQASLPLATRSCPAWVEGNAGAGSYYAVSYQGDLLAKLVAARAHLSVDEGVGLADDLDLLADIDAIQTADAMGVGKTLAAEREGRVAQTALELLQLPDSQHLLDPTLRPAYDAMLRATLAPAWKRIGLLPAAHEPDDTRVLRPALLSVLGGEADDPAVVASAKGLAEKWLASHQAVPAELAPAALGVAGAHADVAFADRLLAAAAKADNANDRNALYVAAAAAQDPKVLDHVFTTVLASHVDPGSLGMMLGVASSNPRTAPLLYAFAKAHWDELVAHTPHDSLPRLLWIGAFACTPAEQADVQSFLAPRVKSMPGAARTWANLRERIGACITRQSLQQPGVAKLLAAYGR